MRYKCKSRKDSWKIIQTEGDTDGLIVDCLVANTTYVFQVRGVKGGIEGSYSPANEDIRTQESLASQLLRLSIQLTHGNPSKFQLPFNENKKARNEQMKIRQMCLGD
jgi:hypothetical protein